MNPSPRPALLLGLLVALACIAWASSARWDRYAASVEDGPAMPHSGPVMSTLDAYYALRWAAADLDGRYKPHAVDPLRLAQRKSHPEGAATGARRDQMLEWLPQRAPQQLPATSRLSAFSARLCGDLDYCAGVLLPIALSSLFIIPLFVYCWRLGYPAAGILAGLVTTFSSAYYLRSGPGWLDTDVLNLFFPWTVATLFLFLHRGLGTGHLLVRTLAAGLVLNLYMVWYTKPFVALAFLATLIMWLAVERVGLRRLALATVAFAIAMNPVHLLNAMPHLARFLAHRDIAPAATGVAFPNPLQTVSELQQLSVRESLSTILANGDAAAAGLIAFAVFAVLNWRLVIPLLPMLALGVLSLLGAQRFAMYLAPFAGLGLGLLVCAIIYALGERMGARSTAQYALVHTLAYTAVLGLFAWWLVPKTAIAEPYRPALAPSVYAALQGLGDQLPPDARIWTWWDSGFAIAHIAGRAVYHDGGAQYTPQTNLIARSFAAAEPEAMHRIIAFVDAQGNAGIARLAGTAESFAGLVGRVVAAAQPAPETPVYVLYTADMIAKWPAIEVIAGLRELHDTSGLGQVVLDCSARVSNVLRCDGGDVDLERGLVADRYRLSQALLIEDGQVRQVIEYPGVADGWYLQVLLEDRQPYATYLLDRGAFRSNFNQMFLLGRYDPTLFEEVENAFPAMRLYRVR